MNKLSNLIFVRREGLEQKWWHRLAQVLICASTAVVLVIGLLNVISISKQTYPVVYTNEHKLPFSSVKFISTAQQQGFSEEDIELWLWIHDLKDLPLNSQYYPSNNTVPLTNEQMEEMVAKMKATPQSVIDQQTIQDQLLTNIASSQKTNYLINKSFIVIILFPIVWFIFWESIFYRAIVYVIYGKRKSY